MTKPDIRDKLALDRTLLANERTLLAYVRTSLTILAAGVGLLEFVDSRATNILGWLLIVAGVLVLPVGVRRFLQVRKDLRKAS